MQAASDDAGDMPAIWNLRALSPRAQQLIFRGNRRAPQVYEVSCRRVHANLPRANARMKNLSG